MVVENRLKDRSRIAVIGGGPAGSFFALFALHYARQVHLDLQVTIFEARDFSCPGPPGCNMCAGIIPAFVLREMEELDLKVPAPIIQGVISSYVLHTRAGTLRAAMPDPEVQVISVFRGNGPRRLRSPPISFDGFLLEEARRRGARVVLEPVEEVSFQPQPWVRTPTGGKGFDLVVLATGVNGGVLPLRGIAYAPPSMETMAQAELWLGEEAVQRCLGSAIHVFLPPSPCLTFGTLIPKGAFVSVSLLGKDLDQQSIEAFLHLDEVRSVLPEGVRKVCACQPRIAVSWARRFFGEGFVAVGDAAVTRLYKNGIGTALVTARQAARTAVLRGITGDHFEQYYAPVCRRIRRDNRVGRLLFAYIAVLKRYPRLIRPYLQAVEAEQEQPVPVGPWSRILWGLFTGTGSYRGILRQALTPMPQFQLLTSLFSRPARAWVHPSA